MLATQKATLRKATGGERAKAAAQAGESEPLDRAALNRELELLANSTADDPTPLISAVEDFAQSDSEFVNLLCSAMLPSTRRQKPDFDAWPAARKRGIVEQWHSMWVNRLRDLRRQQSTPAMPREEQRRRWAPLVAPEAPPSRAEVSKLLELRVPSAPTLEEWQPRKHEVLYAANDADESQKRVREQRERHAAFQNSPQWAFVNDGRCPIFELYTEEMVSALAVYLSSRLQEITELRASRLTKPLTMLEVGAGDGRLSHYLRGRLPPGVCVIATDAKLRSQSACAVESLDVRDAVARYEPSVILSCWMPAGRDWTADFRRCEMCEEYVLIGPANMTSGHEWLTWGARGGRAGELPPYEADGWELHEVPEVSRWQLSRSDVGDLVTASMAPASTASGVFVSVSATTAFRRRSL